MLHSLSSTKLALVIGLVSITKEAQALERGLAWATNNQWAPVFDNSGITWYHHWQSSNVTQMASNIQYVPMDWGPMYSSLWAKRQVQMQAHQPEYLLTYNEPDVPSQANMTPSQAVKSFMSDIVPWQKKGVLVSSPQIVWNTTWMAAFMSGIRAQGADVDFMAIHYYGSWNDTATPKKYIKKIYNTYGKKIWITELGTTEASGGTQADQTTFMNSMLTWMESQSYIDRVVWSGTWSVDTPPDDYINDQDGMLYSNGTLRPIGLEYAQISAAATTKTTAAVQTTTSTTSSKPKSTTTLTITHSVTASSSSKTSVIPVTSNVKATPTSHPTTTSSKKMTSTTTMKKATSTSTKRKTTTTTKHKSTSTHHHHHHHKTTTSKKHHKTTTSKKKSTATHKARCLVNKGNVARAAIEQDQAEVEAVV